MNKPLYLDYHATTPVAAEVLQAMLPYFTDNFGNAGSRSHSYGWTAEQAVEVAREEVARLIGATPHEIIFTSGATESNNLALIGAAMAAAKGQARHIITAATEHKSVLDTCKYLETTGCELTVLPVDAYGTIHLDDLKNAIKPHTILISIMWANNEIGTLQPIEEIGRLAREKGILFHSDAVQGLSLLPMNVEESHVDLLSISGHKMYGPKGIGALFVRRRNPRVQLAPLFHGGGQERNLRSGTLNVPGIVGLGAASKLALLNRDLDSKNISRLRDRLFSEIQNAVPMVRLNGHPTHRLPNNLNLRFEGMSGEALLAGLRTLAISTGSTCLEGLNAPSHVLSAIGLSKELVGASLRFGLGRQTSDADITTAVSTVVDTVNNFKNRSPLNQFN